MGIDETAYWKDDPQTRRTCVLQVAFKYSLTPAGILNNLAHLHRLALCADIGQAWVIDVTPECAEVLNDPGFE